MTDHIKDYTITEEEEDMKLFERDKDKEIIVVAYFHEDTLRSDIELFYDEGSAKRWLFECWGFLLKVKEIPLTLDELRCLLSELVTIDILKKRLSDI